MGKNLSNAKHFHCSCHATWLPCKSHKEAKRSLRMLKILTSLALYRKRQFLSNFPPFLWPSGSNLSSSCCGFSRQSFSFARGRNRRFCEWVLRILWVVTLSKLLLSSFYHVWFNPTPFLAQHWLLLPGRQGHNERWKTQLPGKKYRTM